MKKKICWRWVYKAVRKDDIFTIIEGDWITSFPPEKICKWFNHIGFEITYLCRMEYCTEWVSEDIPPSLTEEQYACYA